MAIKEGEQYLELLQKKTLLKKGMENKVWFYMQSRFDYYKNVLNMNRVSSDTLNKILPKFFELYDAMMKQEKKFLSQVIKRAVENGELIKNNTDKIAVVLINISDALKHSEEQKAILKNEDSVDYTQGISDMKFLVSLIFKGLKK